MKTKKLLDGLFTLSLTLSLLIGCMNKNDNTNESKETSAAETAEITTPEEITYSEVKDEISSEQTDPIYANFIKELQNPKIVEESKYYRIYEGDNNYSLHMIFDKNGNVVKAEKYKRTPNIVVLNDKIIRVSLQAGTGIETRWTYYYDIEKDIFSDVFYGVFQQYDSRIVYTAGYRADSKPCIVVRDIFDNTDLQTFENFDRIPEAVVPLFIEAEFIDDGHKISVTYLNESYEKITIVFELAPTQEPKDLSEVGYELMKHEKLGGINYLMPIENVTELLGEPDNAHEPVIWGADGLYHWYVFYDKIGLQIGLVNETDQSEGANVFSIRAISHFDGKTERGIQIGSSRNDVLEAYADVINEEENSIFNNGIVAGSIYGGIIFHMDGTDKVTEIFIGASAE